MVAQHGGDQQREGREEREDLTGKGKNVEPNLSDGDGHDRA
ncbi:MAG: hypothetical protein AAFX85_01375 [Pseudomonadota bacterium]